MRRKIIIKNCEYCNNTFETTEPRKRFCNHSCSSKLSNSKRPPMTEEQKTKISKSIKQYYIDNPNTKESNKAMSISVGKYTKGKHKTDITSIFELCNRSRCKIILRLDLSCSVCGWDKCIGDLHHINGRKIDNPHDHTNLCYLCPNCHRMSHNGLIDKNSLITFEEQVGDKWKEYYYG